MLWNEMKEINNIDSHSDKNINSNVIFFCSVYKTSCKRDIV